MLRAKIISKTVVKRNLVGYSFILPALIGLFGLTFFPMIQSLYYSFFKSYDGINLPRGFGIDNYIKMFTRDQYFFPSLIRTIGYSLINVPMMLFLGFLVALLLNSKIKFVRGYRLLIYLPVIIPSVAFSLFWRDVFSGFGLLNGILTKIGLQKGKFIYGEESAFVTFLITGLWGVGGNMILWLSSLRNVPEQLYESARVEGASKLTQLLKITVPMCTPMIFYNLIVGIIGSLQTFSTVFLLTKGGHGPNESLLFFVTKIYDSAFRNWQMGYACALSWILFLIIAALTFIVFKTSKWVFYGEEA